MMRNIVEIRDEMKAVVNNLAELSDEYWWLHAHGKEGEYEVRSEEQGLFDRFFELEQELQAESERNAQALEYEALEARLMGLRVRG